MTIATASRTGDGLTPRRLSADDALACPRPDEADAERGKLDASESAVVAAPSLSNARLRSLPRATASASASTDGRPDGSLLLAASPDPGSCASTYPAQSTKPHRPMLTRLRWKSFMNKLSWNLGPKLTKQSFYSIHVYQSVPVNRTR